MSGHSLRGLLHAQGRPTPNELAPLHRQGGAWVHTYGSDPGATWGACVVEPSRGRGSLLKLEDPRLVRAVPRTASRGGMGYRLLYPPSLPRKDAPLDGGGPALGRWRRLPGGQGCRVRAESADQGKRRGGGGSVQRFFLSIPFFPSISAPSHRCLSGRQGVSPAAAPCAQEDRVVVSCVCSRVHHPKTCMYSIKVV